MAKKVRAIVKLQIPAGEATPAPPVGTGAWSAWRQHHGLRQGVQLQDGEPEGQHRTRGDHGVRGPFLHLRHEDVARIRPVAQGGGSRAGKRCSPARECR
ncbi:50S ribosomal protein L11 [Geodia barretti]|uniref:50S ribosomal protein L11 n=1 Tax=Geodia barretti TaxID=519541 RepID=A0AA35SDP1_GEOBA|nr:50S ribosomal protein L11 [Geodia barretti]